MNVVVKCPNCPTRLVFPAGGVGHPGKCPRCDAQFTIRNRQSILKGLGLFALLLVLAAALLVPTFLESDGSWSDRFAFAGNFGAGTDDEPNSEEESVRSITLPTSGSIDMSGSIDSPDEEDLFQFEAPHTGVVSAQLKPIDGSAFRGMLLVVDAGDNEVSSVRQEGDVTSVAFPVLANETYTIKARGEASSTGNYVLSLESSTDVGGDFATAMDIQLLDDGTLEYYSDLEPGGDSDVFRLTIPNNGILNVQQRATSGSSLDSYLYVFDSDQRLLAENDDGGLNTDSMIDVGVTEGQVIYIKADAYSGSREVGGEYVLSLSLGEGGGGFSTETPFSGDDDFGNSFEDAETLLITPGETLTQRARIEFDGDFDMFQLSAAEDGNWIIEMVADGSASLDTFLRVYDSDQFLLGENDDRPADLNSRLQIRVAAGETYFIEASPLSGSGGYTLTVEYGEPLPDDFSDSFQNAHELDFGEESTVAVAGEINSAGDSDVFRFVAPTTGTLNVTMTAPWATSELDTYLQGYDSAETLLEENDDTLLGFSLNSKITLQVTEGETYYLRASASPAAATPEAGIGSYLLNLGLGGMSSGEGPFSEEAPGGNVGPPTQDPPAEGDDPFEVPDSGSEEAEEAASGADDADSEAGDGGSTDDGNREEGADDEAEAEADQVDDGSPVSNAGQGPRQGATGSGDREDVRADAQTRGRRRPTQSPFPMLK